MIKVKVLLDGNQFGYYDVICNETVSQFIERAKNNRIIILTEKGTNRIISIPITKYVVMVESIDE